MYGGGDYSDCYVYLANGTKILHEYKDRQQDECRDGSLVYDQGVFESAPFGGGRIVGTDNGSEVHYFLTDHIGSTRVVAKVTTAGRDDLDRKDYYPFGKAWTQSGMPISENRYTFSGKEQVDVAIEDGSPPPSTTSGRDIMIRTGHCFSSRIRSWKSTIPLGSTTIVREIRYASVTKKANR